MAVNEAEMNRVDRATRPTMKAVTYRRYGGPDVLEFVDIVTPTPNDDQVLVRVGAASINAADYRLMRADPFIARFASGLIRPKKWPVLGSDFAGVIEAVGRNVDGFSAGDRVFGDSFADGRGAFAEYVCVSPSSIVPVPEGLTAVEAASIPLAAITALQAIRDVGQVESGETVLVHGAGGGVGTMAVQLAKAYGADVTALCGPGSVDAIRDAGADRIVDYTTTDIATDPRRYDVILGVNGYRSPSEYKRLLNDGGRFVMIGGENRQFLDALLVAKPVFAFGAKSTTIVQIDDDRRQTDLEELCELVAAGRLHPVVARTFPLERVEEAFTYVESGHVPGKVVLTVAAD